MMQDQINFYSIFSNLRIKCYACNKTGHLINECKMLHFCADREKVIKLNDFSHPQDRKAFLRKQTKKKRAKVFQQKTYSKLNTAFSEISQTYNFDNNSSDEENDEANIEQKPEEKNEEQNNIFFKQISSSAELSSPRHKINVMPFIKASDTKNFKINLESAGERKSFLLDTNVQNSPKPRISISKVIDDDNFNNNKGREREFSCFSNKSFTNKKSYSREHTNETMKERGSIRKSIQFSREITKSEKENDMNSPNNKTNSENFSSKTESKKKLDEEEENLQKYEDSNSWDFDKIHNYHKYFPDNNFTIIAKNYNKRQNVCFHNACKRKFTEMKKYLQYTIFCPLMYDQIKRRKTRKRTMNTSAKHTNFEAKVSERKTNETFFNLIQTIMRKNREKNKRQNVFSRIKSFVNKLSKNSKIH